MLSGALWALVLGGCHRLDGKWIGDTLESAGLDSLDSRPDSRDSKADSGDSQDSQDSRDSRPDSQESQESRHTGDSTPDPFLMPWQADGFWEEIGPLEALILPAEEELVYPGTEVLYATSPDGVDWTAGGSVIIHHMSSLDIYNTGDGIVMLGLIGGDSGFLNQPGSIYALSTQDLQTWGSHAWAVQNLSHQNLVDPAWHLTAAGELGLSYFSTDFVPGLDPVFIAGPHDIRVARWDGAAFVEEQQAVFSAEGLVDAMICPDTDSDDLLLFSTESAARIITARSTDHGRSFTREPWTWEGATVPYCQPLPGDAEGATQVLAQIPGTIAQPQSTRFIDGQGFAAGGDLWQTPPWTHYIDQCNSPIMTEWDGGWLMFCVATYQSDPRL